MKFFILVLALTMVACGGAGASVGDFYDDAAAPPDARVQPKPDAAVPDAPLPPEPDAGEDAPDGASGTCPALVVSLPPGGYCGPQGPGKVCGTSGTIYVCKGAFRPAIAGCVLYSQHDDVKGDTYTRTLCAGDAWVAVDDPTKLCPLNFPLRFHGQPGGAGTPPEPPVVGGCLFIGSTSWTIDGVSGSAYCCSTP